MASAKKTSSNSKTSSQKSKLGSPMKKKTSSQSNSPKKSNKSKKSPKHPGYQNMVTEALKTLNARNGSTRSKIMNHIKSAYGIESGKSANAFLRAALEALLKDRVISLAKGTGPGNGYYRMAPKGKKRSSSPKKRQRSASSSSQKQTGGRRTSSKGRSRSPSKKKSTGRKSSRSPSKKKSTGRKSSQKRSRSPSKKNLLVVNHHKVDHQAKRNLPAVEEANQLLVHQVNHKVKVNNKDPNHQKRKQQILMMLVLHHQQKKLESLVVLAKRQANDREEKSFS